MAKKKEAILPYNAYKIGNYILDGERLGQVVESEREGLLVDYVLGNKPYERGIVANPSGVPLSVAVLQAFGEAVSEHSNFGKMIRAFWKKSQSEGGNNIFTLEGELDTGSDKIPLQISYAHQLQNLHDIVEGEPLKLII